jgi:hypothetical protein
MGHPQVVGGQTVNRTPVAFVFVTIWRFTYGNPLFEALGLKSGI